MWPSENLRETYEKKIGELKPVIKWVTHIAQIKEIPKGFPIGYGLTYISSKEMRIAVIPQGYSDGYDRKLSNIGEVIIKENRCKVLGRVAMNMFVVDITNIKNVELEEEVTLLGKTQKLEITAEETAEKISTINYEVTTRISSKLPRVVQL